jgi:ABC-type glycerol-3-phosphate transport system permease component
MDDKAVDKKYTDFIEDLISQVTPLLPEDVNELQKNYLIQNMRKSANLMASSMVDNEEYQKLDFDGQCFYIQIIAEWSFHKEIDLFRSGISPKYWKCVMNKIWYVMWEVMYACVKNDAPEATVLSLVEKFVNRAYFDAIEELKESSYIDDKVEEKAKEQSNIRKMALEYKIGKSIVNRIKNIILRIFIAIIIAGIVSFAIIKFKVLGLVVILTFLLAYHFVPVKSE